MCEYSSTQSRGLVAVVPDGGEHPAGPDHPGELGVGAVRVEPVVRLGGDRRVDRTVGERDATRPTRPATSTLGRRLGEYVPHLRVRLDGDHLDGPATPAARVMMPVPAPMSTTRAVAAPQRLPAPTGPPPPGRSAGPGRRGSRPVRTSWPGARRRRGSIQSCTVTPHTVRPLVNMACGPAQPVQYARPGIDASAREPFSTLSGYEIPSHPKESAVSEQPHDRRRRPARADAGPPGEAGAAARRRRRAVPGRGARDARPWPRCGPSSATCRPTPPPASRSPSPAG